MPVASQIRRSPRFPFHTGIDIKLGDAIVHSQVENLSREGMFVATAEEIHEGEMFQAWLRLIKPVKLTCIVARVADHRGVGVRYVVS